MKINNTPNSANTKSANTKHKANVSDELVKKAVALDYEGGDEAPKVTATATGELAEEIVKIALEHEVPLFENPQLVELLSQIELGDEIPEDLYHAIAHIIAFAYRIQGKAPEAKQKPNQGQEQSQDE